jgi:hypothetical protein
MKPMERTKQLKYRDVSTPSNVLKESLVHDEILGGWKKLHDELHNLYSSPNVLRMKK